ncbi:(2Fe-2S)-binding protein [Roseixanthobacter liquoris]|uniref:(2Fe-2S)-binding protein n=2 Tax=Hyphomicrobiales TaxID=356 RepID=UPI0037284F89
MVLFRASLSNGDLGRAMIVCSCNVFSDHQVRDALASSGGARSPGEVYRCLGCSPQCGRCARTIRAIMDQVQSSCSSCPAECPAAALTGRLIAAE